MLAEGIRGYSGEQQVSAPGPRGARKPCLGLGLGDVEGNLKQVRSTVLSWLWLLRVLWVRTSLRALVTQH